MKMTHDFIEHQLLERPPVVATPRRSVRGQVALVVVALLAATLAIATVPEPHHATSAIGDAA